MCPMCDRDIEHLAHIFFDCDFAKHCWSYLNLNYDMSTVEHVPEWVLLKLAEAPAEEVIRIFVVLWGIWFWRNKKVWENRSVSADFAMEGSFKMVNEWKEAKRKQTTAVQDRRKSVHKHGYKWTPPEVGALKINVDASVFPGSYTFSIGMLVRDHQGSFLAGRRLRLPAPASVFEAEVIGVKEALSWLADKQLSSECVQIETYSQLTEHAIRRTLNVLEVGDVIRSCCLDLQNMSRTTVTSKQGGSRAC